MDILHLITGIRSILTITSEGPVIKHIYNDHLKKNIQNESDFKNLLNGIPGIYLKYSSDPEKTLETLTNKKSESGFETGVIFIENSGLLGIGNSRDEANHFINQITRGTSVSFVEEERKGARLRNKIAIVTGGAQGFGKGIVKEMVFEGAYVMIADINEEVGIATVDEINREKGKDHVFFTKTDVTDSSSVKNMVEKTVKEFGGLDILISNAGVLYAGSLNELDEKSFDLVTDVNYKGFYLCTKHCSEVMRIQNRYNPNQFMDIIQVNSKSGLSGSNKNFAYSGSKFGAIGLTQSFALELIPYNIKVNAICPGNFFEGPLWADPEKGLFAQYLKAGKVPGAKNIEDVRKFYEAKVPMKRGCTPGDVVKAIYYIIEQNYETGQAVPVTGGQVMLN